jgi:protein-tyrosine-phosphatase
MAEGFARAYGADVMIASSAGTAPAGTVVRQTVDCMAEKHIDVRPQFSKSLNELDGNPFDLVVNMSGSDLPGGLGPVRTWEIPDPIWHGAELYRSVRDRIETSVQQLIVEFRKAKRVGNGGPDRARDATELRFTQDRVE